MKLVIVALTTIVLSAGVWNGGQFTNKQTNAAEKTDSLSPSLKLASATMRLPDPTNIDADLHNGGTTVLKDIHGTYEILDDKGHQVQEGDTLPMYLAPGGDVVYPVQNDISGIVDGEYLLRFKLTDGNGIYYEVQRSISVFH